MKLYLVQHGEAVPESIDPTRPLSEQGRRTVQCVAAFAARMGLQVHQIRNSGKARAEQTAATLGEALAPPGGVIAVAGLAPKDDVQPVADALAQESQAIMLVGHLPFLAHLAGLLLTGDASGAVVRFCNAGIICLARGEGRWQVAWLLTPEMAGAGE